MTLGDLYPTLLFGVLLIRRYGTPTLPAPETMHERWWLLGDKGPRAVKVVTFQRLRATHLWPSTLVGDSPSNASTRSIISPWRSARPKTAWESTATARTCSN